MKLIKYGISLSDSDWQSARPCPCGPQDRSFIEIHFNDSPPVLIDEKFLTHAVSLLAFDGIKRYPHMTEFRKRMVELGKELIKLGENNDAT